MRIQVLVDTFLEILGSAASIDRLALAARKRIDNTALATLLSVEADAVSFTCVIAVTRAILVIFRQEPRIQFPLHIRTE